MIIDPVIEILYVTTAVLSALMLLYIYIDGYRPAKKGFKIISDPESRKAFLSLFASEIFAVVNYSLMGQASGDAKKLSKAKKVVMDAVVNDVLPTAIGGQYAPILQLLMKSTGVTEFLQEDEQNLEYLMKAGGVLLKDFDISSLMGGNEDLSKPRGGFQPTWE